MDKFSKIFYLYITIQMLVFALKRGEGEVHTEVSEWA